MARPWCGLLSIPLFLMAGCHTGSYVNAHLESVNAEYRQLEDYVTARFEQSTVL